MPPKKKPKIKKQTLLEKFREEEKIMMGTIIPPDSRRPFTPKAVDTVKECEIWRKEIIYDISEKVEQIADRRK
jgi:pre-mRNA-splicing factor ISY1